MSSLQRLDALVPATQRFRCAADPGCHGFDRSPLQAVLASSRAGHTHGKDFQVELSGGNGKVFLRYEDMTDLEGIGSGSVDLVWSGQSIEHVTPEAGQRMCDEAFRVLRPGGRFCLDTPNRLITELHAATVGSSFVHPDHKIEYTPDQLRAVLKRSGFSVAEEWGICEMPLTVRNKSFCYDDFVVGGAISRNIDDCYIQFFECVRPLA